MAHGKVAAPARRSRSAPRNASQVINVKNVAFPFSMVRDEESAAMRVGDWISLAGLAVSVIGFSVVIRELIRIAHAPEAGQDRHRVVLKQADPVAGRPSS